MQKLFSELQIQKRVQELSSEILKEEILNNNKNNKQLNLICILEGSLSFFKDLIKYLKENIEINNYNIKIKEFFIQAKSYEGITPTSNIKIIQDLTKKQKEAIKNKEIYIVEDIVDTGNTILFLKNHLKQFNPKSIKIISLLNKPSKRKQQHKNINPDYCCFEIEDLFVIGYGLDFNGKYRDLSYITEL